MKKQLAITPLLFLMITSINFACNTNSDSSRIDEMNSNSDASAETNRHLNLVLASDYLVDDTFEAELELRVDEAPADFDQQELNLILGNPNLLQVSEDNPLVLRAVAVGQTTVQYDLNGLVSNEVVINISEQPGVFSELRIVTTTTEANIGETLQLSAIASH